MALDDAELSMMEGNTGFTSVSVCAHLTDVRSGLRRDVVLLLNTSQDTAGKLKDTHTLMIMTP